ncbi:DUF4411 family protein [Rhodospirillum rubrum]|uniref:PIN domain-containing protein n=1 Tax=Rhodospirillum rubrum (strain ATCC 11170 / ATH 1.1.1 / DSM 467 / LMG 4362 / NCIMB 8255 / S1) TaxID=269796 RepID=Q2RX03_RHORT|nr:DUF4411 family protein [Rhodospirillum rubrum]ABC21342.1 conserved hypothetical protein [Rhodospirillum rubrum ATCC 11170]MBK5952928.1 DNA-binding protein [Rhodospirillum rubrum]QXG81023.1 DUF4411 family protein [Rhodospirillum rubrum]HAQ00191.1 DUF4411 domain-containing protein [Rhodospirillum rubrum]HCF16527.1 DUF4411 domain-containing protein [Rhodospirillum rubrum]
MLYLIDANVLIRAHEDYYGIDQVPQFWIWLLTVAEAGLVKMPFEIHDEIAVSTGPLSAWIKLETTKERLILDEEVKGACVDRVLREGYAPDLDDSELEKMGRDPFLIAYALAAKDRIVVTKEVSRPGKKRANRKIPDVCAYFGIKCMKDFDFFRSAGFNTK